MLKPYFSTMVLFLSWMARTNNIHGWTPLMNRAVSRRTLNTANRYNYLHQPLVRHFQSSSPISSSTLYDEFRNLVLEIQKHDNLYYNSQPVLTDEEYDALVQQEAKLCTNHPEFVTKLLQTEGVITRYAGGRVGYQPASEEKLSHLLPMLSLDNIHSEAELIEWLWRIQRKLGDGIEELEITTEPKLDGLSLSLRYDAKGELCWAATRGDGMKGQNVTMAIQDMGASSNIPRQIDPKKIPNNKEVEIRGEVILPRSVFEKLRQQKRQERDNNSTAITGSKETSAELHFSNSRNAASGILLRKANNQTIRRDLKFFAYDMVFINDGGKEGKEILSASKNDINIRSTLLSLGFQIPEPHLISKVQLLPEREENKTMAGKIIGLEPISDYIHQYFQYKQKQQQQQQKQKQKKNLDLTSPPIFHDTLFGDTDFDMDGAVHKVSSTATRSILGSSKRSPRWAIAHKIPPQTFVTKLLGIDIQVGRTGAITPVAQLEPLEISGVTVKRATLHNFGHLQQLMGDNVTEVPVGTPVLVRRAGEVIPQVVQRVAMAKTNVCDGNSDSIFISLKPPTHCPVCASKTIWEESVESSSSSVASNTSLICSGPPLHCSSRAVAMLQHAFSRDALDIKGLSESRIKQLRDEKFIQVPADLFTLMDLSPSEKTHDVSHNKTFRIEQLENLEGWGPKSVQNLHAVCQRVMKEGLSLERFIYSLGIKQTGKHTSELLASLYGGQVELFLNDLELASSPRKDTAFEMLKKESDATKGIGPVLIDSLYDYSQDSQLLKAAKKLSSVIPVIPSLSLSYSSQKDDNTHNKPWKGWSVVFTGSIPGFTRAAAETLAIQLLGAKSTPKSVTKKTTLIVVGNSKGRIGKKLAKAEELGIATLSVDAFLNLVKEKEKRNKTKE